MSSPPPPPHNNMLRKELTDVIAGNEYLMTLTIYFIAYVIFEVRKAPPPTPPALKHRPLTVP